MLHLLAFVISVVGVAMIAGAVIAYRDRPSSIARAALPGAGLLIIGFILAHDIPSSAVAVLGAGYMFASVIAGCGMTLAKIGGRLSAIPGGTLAFAAIDTLVLDGWAGVGTTTWLHMLSTWAALSWGLAFSAWMLGLVGRAFAAPILARRRTEADAAIAHMQAAERAANEGEGW